jgi:CBS domain-containing protein
LQDEDREYGYLVERGNKFVGIVSIDSLKTALSEGQGIDAALIDAPQAVDAQTPLSELLSHVGQAPCAVPVVGEGQQYVGIISKRMLLQALDREGQTMADQSNPWDTTEGGGQRCAIRRCVGHHASADRWRRCRLAEQRPAPAPEHFNIMDPFHKTLIPLDSWVTDGIDWVVMHFRPVFQGIRVPVDYILSAFQQLMLGMPAPVAIILFSLIAWQFPASAWARHADFADCHRRYRRLVAGDGHPGAGADRPAVLYADRPAAGDLAGAQPAGGENYSSAAGCDADHAGVRLSGADRDAVRYRQRAGRGGHHYLRPAADCSSDHSGD